MVVVTCMTRRGDMSPLGIIRGAVRCLLVHHEVLGGVCTLSSRQPAKTDMALRFSVVVSGYPVAYPVYLVPTSGNAVSPTLHADLTRSILESDRNGGHCCCGGSGSAGRSSLIFVRREDVPEVVGHFGPDWREDQAFVRRFLLRLFLWWPREAALSEPDDDGLLMVGHDEFAGSLRSMTGLKTVNAVIHWLCESGFVDGITNPTCRTVAWYRMRVDDITGRICSGDRHASCATCAAAAAS